jgi:gas vesicle protein
MNSGKVILGVLAGFAAGALMGVLSAPESGAKTRKNILGKTEDYADALKGKFDEMVDNMTKKLENTMKSAEDMAANGKAKYDEAKKEVKNLTA